jgi:hypothetical protein
MKTIFILLLSLTVVSCASTKLAIVPVGQWDYTVKGTPNGDFAGVLIVSLNGEKYSAALKGQTGDITFDDTQYDKKLKKLTGTFYFQSNPIYFETIIEGDTMKGTVSAGGESWPFNATRKK